MTTNPAIVLVGFMGAGKTSTAQLLADSVEQVWDLDDWIERHIGMPISSYFETWTEEQFRREEAELASKLLRDAAGGVVALGGGTVLSDRVRAELKEHIVVWLQVDLDTAWERVADTDRPLAQDKTQFDALFFERCSLYNSLADVVLPQGDKELAVRAFPAIQALKKFPGGTKLLWATSKEADYPVFVGRDLLSVDWWPLGGRRFCVTDETAGKLYARSLKAETTIEIPPGESSKDLGVAEGVLNDLSEAGMTREDHVVALGGGVVGDLAGFCAHIYQRGVPVVHVPTTLVAQVDSAYGGKTGVDTDFGKNYAGAYHQPAAVLSDTQCLASLPREELAAGFVEVLKTSLLAGGELWERVRAIDSLNPTELDDIVFSCARYKCSIVAADERDSGLREVLNLGHTVGHAIEAASNYEMRHGEAIGLGLLAALRLSDAPDLRDEVSEILAKHGLPCELDMSDWRKPSGTDLLLEMLNRDKKRTAAGVGFVLLRSPGDPQTGQILDGGAVRAAIEELYK